MIKTTINKGVKMTKIEGSKIRHTVVVYSGSTCMCGTLQHTERECGHLHKTEEAAQKCRKRLVGYKNGSCSAAWYNSGLELRDTKDRSLIDDHSGVHFSEDLCRC